MTFALRPYQLTFIDDIRSQFKLGHRNVVGVAPCGSGKTVITAWITKQAVQSGKSVLFMVHRHELIEQTSRTFFALGINHGIIASGSSPEYDLPVQIASVQTLVRRLNVVPRPDLLICDECHHILASNYKHIINQWQPYLLGVTATPLRLGGVTLGDIFDSMVVGPSVSYLISKGNLTNFDYYAPPTNIDFKKLRSEFGEFRTDDMINQMDRQEIIGDVVKYYKEYSANKQAICYCINVSHSKHTADIFNQSGILAAHVDGETPKDIRRAVIDDFRNGNIQILCNAELFGEGFDVLNCETVILIRPTKSLTLYIQQAMRSMRPDPHNPNKKAIIIDHVENYKRFGLIDIDRQWSLDPNVKRKKKEDDSPPPTKHCPNCNAVLPISTRFCPNCRFEFPVSEITVNEEGLVTKIHDSSLHISHSDFSADNKIIIKPTTIEDFIAIAQRKGYKKFWAAKQALNFAQSLDDCQHIADVCDYNKGWAWHQWQDLQDTNVFANQWLDSRRN